MEFLIRRDDLVRALARAQGIVEKRTTNPILSAVLLQAGDGGLRMVATDKAMTFLADVAANVRVPGEVAVDAAHLFQVARVLSGDVVTVTLLDNQRVEVRCGSSTFKLSGYPGSDFPVTPPLDQSRSLQILTGELRRVLDQTLYAVAPEDNRYGLNGAHLEDVSTDTGPMLRVVATDGNRLSWAQAPYTGELGIGRKMLLPRKALKHVQGLLEADDAPVEIAFGERAGVIRLPGALVHMRLLEADFPDYRTVLPNSFKRQVNVEREVLLRALERVAIFAADSAHSVRFAFGPEALVLTSRKLDAGDSREELPVDLVGEPITLGFNAVYLSDVLRCVAGDRLLLQLGDVLSPCIVRVPDDDRCLFVVMPLRLD